MVEENTAATEEMAAGATSVNLDFENIASVSEEHSATFEEVTASTEEMNAQALEALEQVVAAFQLEQQAGRAPAPTHPRLAPPARVERRAPVKASAD